MKKIPIDQIEDGMVLAKPLLGAAGNVLLNEGIVLKASMISRLRNWDIPIVAIQSEVDEEDAAKAAVTHEFKAQELETLFSDVINDPIMKIVYDATRDHFSNQ